LNYTPIGEDELDKKMAELWDSHGPLNAPVFSEQA